MYLDNPLNITQKKLLLHSRFLQNKKGIGFPMPLANSIKSHQVNSDVEVGAYLSGGVDSSYVVGVAKPDKTFTVGFDENGFDETKLAEEYSKLLDIKNYSNLINKDGKNLTSNYERVTFHPDYSYANFVGTYKPVPKGEDISYE